MLNVYNKYDNPTELAGYEKLYPLAEALRKLRNHEDDINPDYQLNERDIEVLAKNTNIILRSPILSYNYAQDVIKERWPACEPILKDDERLAFMYATYVSHVRWKDIGYPEVEKMFLNSARTAYAYADAVVRGRWEEAEPILKEDPISACYYAMKVMNKRWLEAEPTIQENDSMWGKYKEHFGMD